MKKLLAVLLVASLSLPVWAGEVWVSPSDETFLTRETPFSMALGAGCYIASYEALGLTGMKSSWNKWLAFGITGFGSWYFQREVKHAVYGKPASFTGIGFSMSSAVLTSYFWDKQKKK